MEGRKVIRYIRDCQRRPYGVIVALDKEHIGMSLCNKKDKWDRELGLEIAAGRAGLNKKIPLRLYRDDTLTVFDAVKRTMHAIGCDTEDPRDIILISDNEDRVILDALADMEIIP